MPPSKRPPTYRYHKARNCAVVTIHGKDHYLGPHGSPESHQKYARLLMQWRASNGQPTPLAIPSSNGVVTVNAVILQYLSFAETYYVKHEKLTGELDNICRALKVLKELYGYSDVRGFSADSLESVQEAMIYKGWQRKSINRQVSRVKRMFRWASKKRIVPPETYYGLLSLEPLKYGRSKAKEGTPVTTVDEEHVRKTCELLSRHVGAMVEVQHLTGMRPQDIRNLRTCDLDMSDDVWVYKPWTHKTEHYVHERKVAIGPRAQAILRPFLKPNSPKDYVFTPAEALAESRAEARRLRKTPMTPSQRKRKPKAGAKKKPGNKYEQSEYRRAITRAAARGAILHWHPHQLRHNCGTRVRKLYGLEAARVVLGHSFGIVTEIYAELDMERAKQVMREIG